MQGTYLTTRASQANLLEPDNEIKRKLHQRLREGAESSRQQEIRVESSEPTVMAEPRRTLSDYEWPQFTGEEFNAQVPTVLANNFEIKSSTIGMIQNLVQFDGLVDEGPHSHLSQFL